MFMVLSSWPWSLREFTRFIWWIQTERRVAANPQTKPTDLGCESADKWLLPSTSTIAICYYYSARKLILVLPSTEGGRLSRPKIPYANTLSSKRAWLMQYVNITCQFTCYTDKKSNNITATIKCFVKNVKKNIQKREKNSWSSNMKQAWFKALYRWRGSS